MSKIIVYGFENRLWFGRPTFASWISSFFVPDRLLKVKPFKGFEEYAHPVGKCLRISPQFVKFTNFGVCSDPLTAIMVAEKEKEELGIDKPPHLWYNIGEVKEGRFSNEIL